MRSYWQNWAGSGRRRLEIWLAAAIAINAIAFLMTRAVHHPAVAAGAAMDVAITVPALYFWLVVRAGVQPPATLIPLCLLAMLRATYIAPGTAWLRPAAGAVAEVAIAGFLAVRVRRGLRAAQGTADPMERIHTAMREVLPVPAAARVGAVEAAVLYYAFAWRARPHVPAGARAFTAHQRSGIAAIFGFVAGVSVMEAVLVHLVVARWSVAAAWTLTALSIYGAIWLAAIARSFALRPVLVQGDAVSIRRGLLREVRVSRAQIAEVTEPVEVAGLYGGCHRMERIAIELDEPAGFRATL